MKGSIILIVLACLISNHYFAQVSGYCGKKHEIAYKSFIFPRIVSLYDQNYYRFWNYRNNVSYNYTITRKHKIGVAYEFFNTDVEKPYADNIFADNIFGEAEKIDEYPLNLNRYYKLDVNTYTFNFFIYKDDWISPLRNFYRFALKYISYKTSEKELQKMYNYVLDNRVSTSGGTIGVFCATGYERILLDAIALNIEFELGYVLGSSLIGNDFLITKSNFVQKTGAIRLGHHMLANPSISISYVF